MAIKNFPKNFLWGTAISAHQVEGNNKKNDWWEREQKGGGEEPSGLACDHYNLFEEDFIFAKDVLHNNAHRFSIERSRIEPSLGEYDAKRKEFISSHLD